MKTVAQFLLALALGFLALEARAQGPFLIVPTLAEALALKSGKAVVLQPVQMKPGQKLTLAYTSVKPAMPTAKTTFGILLAIYSTDASDYGTLIHQDWKPVTGAAPQVTVFDPYLASFAQGVTQKGIIAILIGLAVPANGPIPLAPIPMNDGFSVEIRDPGTGIPLLLPAVQKVREAAAR